MDFIGLECHAQQLDYLLKSKSLHVEDSYGVFKSNRNHQEWRQELPKDVIDYIAEDLKSTQIEKYVI